MVFQFNKTHTITIDPQNPDQIIFNKKSKRITVTFPQKVFTVFDGDESLEKTEDQVKTRLAELLNDADFLRKNGLA